jgi:hypothetical protein
MIQKNKLPFAITAVRYSNERIVMVQSDRTFYKIDSQTLQPIAQIKPVFNTGAELTSMTMQ